MRKPRSRSAGKRAFVNEGAYQGWTNTFKRMTVEWDQTYDLLEREKSQGSAKKLEKHPTRCCGNSPSRKSTDYQEFGSPGKSRKCSIQSTNATSAAKSRGVTRVVAKSKENALRKGPKAARNLKSAPKCRRNQSTVKKSGAKKTTIKRVKQPKQQVMTAQF